MAHLPLPSDLLEATLRERGRRGWAAVAPELEPYLDTRRWPSGAPLLTDIATHLRRRTRMAPWVPHIAYLLFAVPFAVVPYLFCTFFAYNGSPMLADVWPSLDDNPLCASPNRTGYWGSTTVNFYCPPCIGLMVALFAVITVIVYGVFRLNKQVEQHVNCLYMMYALAHSTPSMPHDAMHHFSLTPSLFTTRSLEVTVFADGAYTLQWIARASRRDESDHYAVVETIEGNVHGSNVPQAPPPEGLEPLLGYPTV